MIAWIDGRLVPGTAALSLEGPSFRCGMGLFETVLFHQGRPRRLERHLERLAASLAALHLHRDLPAPSEAARLVVEVAHANGLAGETARVNLFCHQDRPQGEATLCITVTPYSIDPHAARALAVYPHAHASHLCAHKTMANLHQRLAWDFARRAGADDALLVDHHGNILEAACAALLFSDGKGFYEPKTPWKLPSLTMEAARRHLHVEEIPLTLADLDRLRHVYWLNSLGGIQPVVRVDDRTLDPDWETCRPLLRVLLGLDG
ncbi:hypothetical protein NNJEOMEG_02474 [Fundidesulfovibrio magnetotacticus]|uniref:4-amino-4-deoxychorismate lyase n=1 Tax=Fundidesulfovibrio magnetotacticus TaxID=2730080 RepID=A0A6V8LY98_9BACT|nr:aminotransferase class IV [Fundidesulfovibrio magnetotacticus]GFK94627.1 hypothetical protein NNJEOMEG_02474 [Fundidesulfovibrio magnetotacticus]